MKRLTALFLLLALLMCGCETPVTPTEPSSGDATPAPTDGPTDDATDPPVNIPTAPPADPAALTINEVMPDNKLLTFGTEADWVEIHNAEDHTVDLDGYYLTDDRSEPTTLPLKGLSIPAGGYIVITLDENSPFRLSADGETVYLLLEGQVVSELTFGLSENGDSFDSAGPCTWSTPGYANDEAGYLAAMDAQALPKLAITEVLSSNSKYYPVGGKCYDLVEVMNCSDGPLDLSCFNLSDKRSEPNRYAFPAVILQPGECYVVLCSGEPSLGPNHASFKISADGENLYLSENGRFIDALRIPGDLEKNKSYGRLGKIPSYLPSPTIGRENAVIRDDSLQAPAASIPTGVYDAAVAVSLTAQGEIYYTLDGSRPTTSSMKYTDPIPVDGVVTIRTICVLDGMASEPAAYTYLVGIRHDLPIVTVAIPQDCLTGEEGVLNHIEEDYEYEAQLTLIENGQEQFTIPFGFRLHGNDSRKGAKQNFQLRFRSQYGAGKLHYKLFDDRDISEFNSLLLKGGSEDWQFAMIRDELATSVVHGTTNLYTQSRKSVVLYLGGQYWGIYHFRERFSDDYVASHLDVSEESVDILYAAGGYAQAGSSADFDAIKTYVQTHDMSRKEHFDYLCSKIDALSLVDWYVCRSYMGDKDAFNVRRFRSVEHDGKWRWMYFDLDWAFWHTDDAPIRDIMGSPGGDNILIHALLSSPQGRDLFLSRYAELLGTVLNERYITAQMDELLSQIGSEMVRDRQRWGVSYDTWQWRVSLIRDFLHDDGRTAWVLKDLQVYFDLSQEEMEHYFSAFLQ